MSRHNGKNRVRIAYVHALMVLAAHSAYAVVELQMTTLSGAPCTRIGVGTPCVAQVICRGQQPTAFPTVKGLDAFRIEGSFQSVNTINGTTSVVYAYQIRPLRPGRFHVGPADVVTNGVHTQSGTVAITVLDAQEAHQEQALIEKAPIVRCHVETNTTSVVQGQTVEGTLRLYCRADQLRNFLVDAVDRPQWSELGIQIDAEYIQGITELDGVEYVFMEWPWRVRPAKVGTFCVPACAITYRIAAQTSRQNFFGMNIKEYRQQRMYSNTVRINVDTLPPVAHPVHAIGTFDEITASLNAASIECLQAATLLITCTGDNSIDECVLQGLPDALRVYDAKKTVVRDKSTRKLSTTFEYVVQGMEVGTWSIPSQTLYFFDPRSRTYKALATPQLYLRVANSSKPSNQQQGDATPLNVGEQDTTQVPSILHECPYIAERLPLRAPAPFSWLLYALLMLLPVVMWIVYTGWSLALRHITHSQHLKKKYAFMRARYALKKASSMGDAAVVYTIFITVWSVCLAVPTSAINHDTLVHAAKACSLSDDQQREWNHFVTRMMSMTYADHKIHDELFFKQAVQWLDYFYPYL